MENIKATIKGSTLILEIDLTKRLRHSGSGKNIIIATTGGNQPVAAQPTITIGVNVYTKAANQYEAGVA
jgi:hypothetical protein